MRGLDDRKRDGPGTLKTAPAVETAIRALLAETSAA